MSQSADLRSKSRCPQVPGSTLSPGLFAQGAADSHFRSLVLSGAYQQHGQASRLFECVRNYSMSGKVRFSDEESGKQRQAVTELSRLFLRFSSR